MTVEAIELPVRDIGFDVEIEIRRLSHSYLSSSGETIKALEDVNLSVRRGEIVSLVGRSGCGKSTLLNILAGLLTPTRGQVFIGSRHSERANGTSRKLPSRAYITQDDRLLPWRTAERNVAFPLELHGVSRRERLDAAGEMLRRVGLGASIKRRPFELSGGMRQRVAIAQALVYDPAVLLMDEPFAALDAWTRQSLHELMIEIHAELGTTTILVTHDVFEALSLSDRVLTLGTHPGRIHQEFVLPDTARPRPHQVLQEPTFLQIYENILADLQIR